jgi:hypothetical protein
VPENRHAAELHHWLGTVLRLLGNAGTQSAGKEDNLHTDPSVIGTFASAGFSSVSCGMTSSAGFLFFYIVIRAVFFNVIIITHVFLKERKLMPETYPARYQTLIVLCCLLLEL